MTGAEAGLGLATTATLIEAGATVIMGCTDAQKGQSIASQINKMTQKQSAWCDAALDLGSKDSIRAWTDGAQAHLDSVEQPLAGLVHHAGVMGLGKYTITADGEEMQWSTNYAGAFRLTRGLWDTLLRDNTQVINLTLLLILSSHPGAKHNLQVLCLTSTSHCNPNNSLDFGNLPGHGSSEDSYNGWVYS